MKTITTKFGSWNEAKDAAELERRKPTYNRKSVNLDYFAEIESSEQAYWLGFIYGDGCIRTGEQDVLRFQLAVAEQDSQHIEAFKETVESDHALNYIKRGGNNQNQVSIVICRREFVQNLISQGADSDKTHSESLPSLEEDLRAPFIRGLYDADGSFSGRRWKITGSNLLRFEQITEWLPVESSISEVEHKGNVWYDLRVGSNSLERLSEFLYPDGSDTTPMLERKLV
ncbi:hypothetical protein VOLN27_82 [Halorubrum virus VOLN27B]|nr:hypothetical protein VOLN27_82 [Halorubrum virus VOLN27B]